MGHKAAIIPAWSFNIGFMADEPAVVRAQGCRCESYPVDLEKLIQAKGRFFSLWNRHPLCKACKQRMTFAAQRLGVCEWQTILETEDPRQTDRLHEIWRAEREALRRADAAWRFIRRYRRRRTKIGQLALYALAGDPREAILTAERGLYRQAGPTEDKLAEAIDVLLEMRRRARRHQLEDLGRAFEIQPDQALIAKAAEERAELDRRQGEFVDRYWSGPGAE